MKSNNVTKIRSTGLTRINQLVTAHKHLQALRPAFTEWAAGEVYVCKKTGDYRYRFGEQSKSVTPWSKVARETFATPAALAFAAMVLGEEPTEQTPAPPAVTIVKSAGASSHRANVIALAAA